MILPRHSKNDASSRWKTNHFYDEKVTIAKASKRPFKNVFAKT